MHPDKNKDNRQEEFIKLKQIFNYLQNNSSKVKHDKYGLKYESANNGADHSLQSYLIEATLIYSSYMVLVMFQLEWSVKNIYAGGSIKAAILILLSFFYGFEVYYLSKENSVDFLDKMFSQTTIYERIQFLRIFSGPFSLLLTLLIHSFQQDLLSKTLQKLDDIIRNQKQLDENLSMDQSQIKQLIKENLTQINRIQSDLVKIINENMEVGNSNDSKYERRKKRVVKTLQLVFFLGVFVYLVYAFQLL